MRRRLVKYFATSAAGLECVSAFASCAIGVIEIAAVSRGRPKSAETRGARRRRQNQIQAGPREGIPRLCEPKEH